MPASTGSNPTLPDAVFSLVDATCAFGELRAVDGVSLDFARGHTSILIGTSGSGKSTLLRMLIGLVWSTAGEVFCDGVPLQRGHVLEVRRRVGYVIQEGGLFPHLTVLGNLALLPRHLGWKRTRVLERARELAALTHLREELFDRFPTELSGGQRQRVALMRALMLDPPTLLLDEPLGALDPLVRHGLQDELRDIFRGLGKTVIMVTHDLAEAAFFGTRLILMRRGCVVQDGSLEDFRLAPADDFVREFLAAHRNLPGIDA